MKRASSRLKVEMTVNTWSDSVQQFHKNFETISISDIPDCEAKGIYLRHRKTGFEVFHLLNSDEENLFAFAFRTPARNSTGAAHILEHAVFCGSEKFPLKEPFVNLMNQSVYTFLNAMTYPDKTVYPASSIDKKDYFHLMDVYADAVFFPLLKRETFLQEGHRLEVDEKGAYAIQGVVYNEMKGNYSSFNSVAFDEQFKSLLRGTCYTNDSGGDPIAIPSLSYEDFTQFHRTYYSPANGLLFLYGNIATEEQLDFIEKAVLDRLEEKYPEIESDVARYESLKKEFIAMETPPQMYSELEVRAAGPASDAKKSSVTLNWRYGKSANIDDTMEVIFLLQLLCGNDSSPLSKALLGSRLGERLISGGGAEASVEMIYFGLSGVKESKAVQVKNLIISTLTNLCKNGISQSDIDAAVLAVDFANREVTRSYGEPFAIELMDRALNSWNYGGNPSSTLCYRAAFEKIKAKLAEDARFAERLVKRLLLENVERAFVIVNPKKSFLKEREKREKRIIAALSKHVDTEALKRETEALHAYQQRKESEEELSCIPHINPSDLKKSLEPIETEITSCTGIDGSDVPLFLNREPTNGIIYIDVCFPADVIPASEYAYVHPFTVCAANVGWNGKTWDECAREISLCCGDMGVRAFTGEVCASEHAAQFVRAEKEKNYIGRDWITFRIKLPVEKKERALALFSEAIAKMEFTDEIRVKTLLDEALNDMRSSLIPSGSRYAALRARRNLSKANAVEEIWSGLTLFFALEKIVKEDCAALGKKFARFIATIRNAGGIVHITADKKSLEEVLPLVPDFVKRTGLHSLAPAPMQSDSEYCALTKLEGEADDEAHEQCCIPSHVGYVAQAVKCISSCYSEQSAIEVLCHWMRNNMLWERIRTTGGAYGASAAYDGLSGTFSLSTYRDPSPMQSLETFKSCLAQLCDMTLGDADIARAVTGSYGKLVHPLSPSARGYVGFKQKLYAVAERDRNEHIQAILSVTAEQLHNAAEKLYALHAHMNSSIICDKSVKTTGFIIDLPI